MSDANEWYEKEDYDENLSIKEYDISATPNDFNLISLCHQMDSGLLKIPVFQRNYVWSQKDASRLIESLLIGLPIPQVFLYEKEGEYLIIDGQQRLLSIYFFVNQRFPRTEGLPKIKEVFGPNGVDKKILNDDRYFQKFNLKLSESPYDKKNYLTLDKDLRKLNMRTVRSITIVQNSPDDDSSIYEIFNRLNTGGRNLSPQEIRASLYYSEFYSMLNILNEEKKWRRCINKSEPDNRFKDIEFLLRSFALLYSYKEYAPSMTKFLNSFSRKARKFTPEHLDYIKKLFISFLDSTEALDEKAFCTNGRFNISLFDAVFVATCEDALEKKELVSTKISMNDIEKLKNPEGEFSMAVQDGTASTQSINDRIRIAKSTLVGSP